MLFVLNFVSAKLFLTSKFAQILDTLMTNRVFLKDSVRFMSIW